jgi:hypothetical protein
MAAQALVALALLLLISGSHACVYTYGNRDEAAVSSPWQSLLGAVTRLFRSRNHPGKWLIVALISLNLSMT